MRLYYRRHQRKRFGKARNQKGYALVSVAMVGMLMLLVTMMIIFRSQSAQAIARAQLLKSQSIVLAEAAAVTYQSFLASYPQVASHNQTEWGNFANAVATDCALVNTYQPAQLQQIKGVAQMGTSWQAVNPNDLSQGQIRLVDYQYTPDPGIGANQAPGTATLRVEGRSRAKGLPSEAFGFGSSRSQLELQFRVDSKPPEELPVGVVGGSFTVNSNPYGTPQISSHVCAIGNSASSADVLKPYMTELESGDPGTIAFSQNFVAASPPEGAQPLNGIEVSNLGDFSIYANQACQLPMLGKTTTSAGAPQGCPVVLNEVGVTAERPVYKYNLSELSLGKPNPSASPTYGGPDCDDDDDDDCSVIPPPTGNSRLILGRTGQEDIHLYVGGDAILNQSRITVTPGTRVFLYLHGSLDASGVVPEGFLENTADAENLQVYMYGDPYAVGASKQKLNFEYGHGTSNAFIFAPYADASLIDFTVDGALWADQVSIVGDSKINQNLADPGLLKIQVPGGQRINPPFSWKEREVS